MFHAVFETGPDALLLVDSNGRISSVNEQAERLFGYRREELIERPVEILLPDRYRPGHVPHREGYMTNPRTRPMGVGLDLYARRKDGSEFPVEISLSPIRLPERTYVASAIRDVTERKQAEEALRRTEQERFAAMGRMAAFVAHQLNTPLTNISLISASIARGTTEARTREYLERINGQRRTAAGIIKELARFSDHVEVRPVEVDLRTVVAAAMGEVESLRKPSVDVVREFAGSEVSVYVDPAQITEVVANLLKNAFEATRVGSVAVRVVVAGTGAEVVVRDTGRGMTPETLGQLFRPFFTTKEKGAGTGLGLAFAKNIVNAHGGTIHVESQVDRGSTFRVWLPANPPESARSPREDVSSPASHQPGEPTSGKS